MSQVSEIIVNWTPETSGRVSTIQIQSRIVGTSEWTEQASGLDAGLGEFRFGSNAPATDVEVRSRYRMVTGVFGAWNTDHIITAPVTVPYVDLTGTPSKLEDINPAEGGKLDGIEPGATVGAPAGTPVAGVPAETVVGAIKDNSGNIIKVADVYSQVVELVATYGSTANALLSANEAKASADAAAASNAAAIGYLNDTNTARNDSKAARDAAQAAQASATTQAGLADTARSAAQAARDVAGSARDAAQAAQSAAQGSATSAGSFASDAHDSATTAAGSAATASAQAGVATQAKIDANNFANSASGSASQSSSNATVASQAANSASAYRDAAQTARGGAESARDSAAQSSNNAAGSASSAASSASVSASAKDASQSIADRLHPREINPDTLASFTFNGTSSFYGPDSGFPQPYLLTFVDGIGHTVRFKSPPTKVAGQRVRLTCWIYTHSPQCRAALYVAHSDSNDGSAVGLAGLNDSVPADCYARDATGFATNGFVKFGFETTIPASAKAFIIPSIYINASEGGATSDAVTHICGFIWEDVTSEYASGQSAAAAASSASSAAASNTAAGQQASAAQASATNASTSAGQAGSYASQASVSASNAAGSSNTAEQKAGVATTAANDAAAYRDQSQGSANSAAGSASTATSKADQAGQQASAAQASATAAGTSAGQASTSANNASTSANNAAGSASSAASSASVSANAKDAAQAVADRTFPQTFTAASLPSFFVSGNYKLDGPDSSWPQPYLLTFNETGPHYIHHKATHPKIVGQRMRLTFWVYTYSQNTRVAAYFGQSNSSDLSGGGSGYSPANGLIPTGCYASDSANIPTGEFVKFGWEGTIENSAQAFIYPEIYVNSGETGTPSISLTHICGFIWQDVTSEYAALQSAAASASSASSAAASNTAAGQQASAAQTSATNANTSAGSASGSAGMAATSASNAAGSAQSASSSASLSASAKDATYNALALDFPPSLDETGRYAWNREGDGTIEGPATDWPGGPYAWHTAANKNSQISVVAKAGIGCVVGERYRITAWVWTDATNAYAYAFGGGNNTSLNWYDGTGSSVNGIDGATPSDCIANSTHLLPGNWYKIGQEYAINGTNPPFQRPIITINTSGNGNLNGQAYISAPVFEKITSEAASKGFANASNQSASNAAASSGAAGNSASAANQSKLDAEAANGSAQSAASSASGSASSADANRAAAASYASQSASYRDQSSGSAGAAAGSAGTAADRAEAARIQAANSSASASEASASASSAYSSSQQSATYRDQSQGSAGAAAGSANAASTSAGNAQSYASQANASAAAASSSATLSARISSVTQSLNANSKFAAWPDGSYLPSNWVGWSYSGGSIARDNSRQTSGNYAAQMTAVDGQNLGILQSVYVTGGWYVLTATVYLQSGSWHGAGLYVDDQTSINFSTDKDGAGIIGSEGVGIRTFSKLINVTSAGDRNIYAMTNWDNFTPTAAKTIQWMEASIRPASDAEVQAQSATGAISSLSATVSNTSSAVASLQSQAATTEQRLLAGQPNLLANSGFDSGLANWDHVPNMATAVFAAWGNVAYGTGFTGGPQVLLSSSKVPIYGGNPYTIAADMSLFADRSNASCYVDVIFFDSSGNVVGDGGQIDMPPQDFSNVASKRLQYSHTDIAPNNATYALARFVVDPAGGTISSASIRRVKLEMGSTMSAYTAEASAAYQAGVLADHSGKLASYLSLTAAAGSAQAAVKLVATDGAGNPYSGIALEASQITLANGDGSNKKVALSLQNGDATFSGALNVGADSGGNRLKITNQNITVFGGNGVRRIAFGLNF